MMPQRTLVVYYSRTGTTRKVAEYIKDELGADIVEIRDRRNRKGPIGWLLAGWDAGNKSLTVLETPSIDPSGYDLVVIGTPVWNDTVSTPIRTYITEYKGKFSQVALFTTQDSETTSAVTDMAALMDKVPKGSIELQRKEDVESGNYMEMQSDYLEELQSSVLLEDEDTPFVEVA